MSDAGRDTTHGPHHRDCQCGYEMCGGPVRWAHTPTCRWYEQYAGIESCECGAAGRERAWTPQEETIYAMGYEAGMMKRELTPCDNPLCACQDQTCAVCHTALNPTMQREVMCSTCYRLAKEAIYWHQGKPLVGDDTEPHPLDADGRQCGARAINGPCILPAGHNMGNVDIPENHTARRRTIRDDD